ncbi:siphovirus ReqiPepy6 Gp37-like family protein [Oscillospiraceae bacterium OttesenSCG-928-G22]|nr:siphovirus ReqiPepy6 Gp37-like family protein [Oscillospiraceae bacterium OttesenSCG-928-G22]
MERKTDYEVRVFEYDEEGGAFVPRGTTYWCASIQFTENQYSPGGFELVLPLGAPYAREFKKYRYVQIGRRFFGVIQSLRFESTAAGDMLTVSGADLLGFLSQRVTIPPNWDSPSAMMGFDGITGPSETVIKHFVKNNIVSPLSQPRKIPGFSIAPDLRRGIQNDKYLSRFESLVDVVGAVGRDAKLGLRSWLDLFGGRIVFDVAEGTDRSMAQDAVPPVVLSVNRQTVLSMNHTDSDGAMRNAFYTTMAGAEFEDEALTLVYYRAEDETTPPSGIMRHEMHMEISADHPTPGQEYNELKRLALIQATNYQPTLTFTCSINHARVKYGENFGLGDIVTLQNSDWGVTLDTEVIGATVSHSGSESSYTVTFGTDKPTFMKTIKKLIQLGGK